MGAVEHITHLQKQLEKCTEPGCEEQTFRKCILCKRPCCPEHLSKEDADYCTSCYSDDSTRIDISPLIDSEGVSKVGRHLIPVGNYYLTFPSLVSRMSREKLEQCVGELAQEVALAQQHLDKARTRLTIAKSEQLERIDNEPKKLRGFTVVSPTGEKTRVATAATPQARQNNLLSQFQKLGVTPEQLLQILQAQLAKKGAK